MSRHPTLVGIPAVNPVEIPYTYPDLTPFENRTILTTRAALAWRSGRFGAAVALYAFARSIR